MLNRLSILQTYPWLHSSEQKNVIMGDDLDAAVATLLYLKHNPKAKLVGFYVDYTTIFYDKNMDIKQLADAIYIDLDIYYTKCRSLGHHIIRNKRTDDLAGFHNSCNLCELKDLTCSDFKTKYPLGTVHFLLWLYKENLCKNEFCEQLVWLADSAYILGQPHKYRENVQNWLENEMVFEVLQNTFSKIDTLAFEEKMQVLQKNMLEKGFKKGYGQAVSQHLQLSGFQLQAEFPKNAHQVFDFIKSITDWQVLDNQIDININNLNRIDFDRKSQTIDSDFDLNDFLQKNKVFSCVFPFADKINYTVFKT